MSAVGTLRQLYQKYYALFIQVTFGEISEVSSDQTNDDHSTRKGSRKGRTGPERENKQKEYRSNQEYKKHQSAGGQPSDDRHHRYEKHERSNHRLGQSGSRREKEDSRLSKQDYREDKTDIRHDKTDHKDRDRDRNYQTQHSAEKMGKEERWTR